jgi:hypothetical protein
MSALWQQKAGFQLGKDVWADGVLVATNEQLTFSGQQDVVIVLSSITGDSE